ncbi:MAG TPA: PIG-L deacetylase family protein [Candidatus Baltobacteraceae bacterium]|nr:PIG-L deacetylase family protein [Candidatus Baltobacteraceae bacterium]
MPTSVLVCAAHPDDEVLGCGATMARHAAKGDRVHVLILGQGLVSRGHSAGTEAALAELRSTAKRANDTLNAASLEMLDFPDNRLDTVARLDLAKAIEDTLQRLAPQIVYTHFPADLNVDHGRVSDAVCVACRPLPGSSVKSLRFFEVQSSTEWRPAAGAASFAPNLYVDVSQTIGKKLDALRIYGREMRPWPHARSLEAVEHLARWRGASAGVGAAEAFMIAREID